MKMRIIMILAFLAIIQSLPFAQEGTGWRGLIPLHSTRASVEKLIGAQDQRCQCYLTETEIVRVKYARGPCEGDLPGWNVPIDTVLSVEIIPVKPLLFSELKVREQDFIKTVDDTVTSYYGNGEGLRYSVSSLGNIQSVWYGPSRKDNQLRCEGFPPSDGGITAYTPYNSFAYDNLENVKGHLGEFGVRLLKDSHFKGYLIVYGAQDAGVSTVTEFAKSARIYLTEELNISSDALAVINGGYRKKGTVELFLIPREWPPPVPTPTLSGLSRKSN